MPTYYVGSGGNDANTGLSWAQRKLTLNGCEDIPVAANDIVYVAPGVYREMLTCDVSGAAGQPITYIADSTGEHTDGIGGPVRITGSDNDQTAARNYCIQDNGTQRNYRTFRGFSMDTTVNNVVNATAAGTNWILEDCLLGVPDGRSGISATGQNQLAWTVRRCVFRLFGGNAGYAIAFNANPAIDNCGHIVENCISYGGYITEALRVNRVGGIIVRNCVGVGGYRFVDIVGALTAGQTVAVNGCIITGYGTGLVATALGEILENYNTFYGNAVARLNVGVGANSQTYPPLFDSGILHAGAAQVSGFKFPQPQLGTLSQWSQVRAIADGGTNATLDINGLARPVTDGKRSWGAVQYAPFTQDTGTVYAGTRAAELSDAGRRQFWIPVTAVATTITVRVYREANYAGVNPQMVIKQPGQADRTTTDAGAAGAWNLLTDTLTPSATPGWICVELVSSNTAAAGAYAAYFDNLAVNINSTLGTMETWLWNSEVADWVQAAGTGGAVSISPLRGGLVG